MFMGYRSNDPVLTICQDDVRKTLEITDGNPQALELLGYQASEIVHLPLKALLPPRIAQLVDEYVEFGQSENDLAAVLGKVQQFAALSRSGQEVACKLKVVRAESIGSLSNFKLVLYSEAALRQRAAFRAVLTENFKGHEVMDPELGLPDRGSLYKDLELVVFYANQDKMKACFAVIEADSYEAVLAKQGPEACAQLMRHIAQIARQNLRSDDAIGCVSRKRLGLLLMDTVPDSARMVLNRLRWLISSTPFKANGSSSIATTISISFAKIGGRVNDKNLIQDGEHFLDSLHGRGGNLLIEIGEVDKRSTKNDRRQRDIPVAFDRRAGGDRRTEQK